MDIDFPLVLVILVFGSGLIWLLDALFLAPGRRRLVAGLQDRYPHWDQEGSAHAIKYQAQVGSAASEPVVVEYAKSFFPVLLVEVASAPISLTWWVSEAQSFLFLRLPEQ